MVLLIRTFRFLMGAGAATALRYPGDDQPILDSAASERNGRFFDLDVFTAAARSKADLPVDERPEDFFVCDVCNDFFVCLLDRARLA